MDTRQKLIEFFEEFPGIGPRQARRFVHHLLLSPTSIVHEISQLIDRLQKDARMCSLCFRFFDTKKNNATLCEICADVTRTKDTLMVVARDSDIVQIERSGSYRGFYFVLGDTLQVVTTTPTHNARVKELTRRVSRDVAQGLTEVIFAFNATPEGEHTRIQLEHQLAESIKIPLTYSTLGRGLSAGLELEYSDTDTIVQAVRHRTSHQ